MPTYKAVELISDRQGEAGDIHEKDHEYLYRCYECATEICERYNWYPVKCVENNTIKEKAVIHEYILDKVLKEINN